MGILSIIFIVAGLFFLMVAAIGVIRLPDVFSRSHAVSLTDSLGAFLMLVGIALHEGLGKNMLGQMKATLNDFIKKPWKVKEDSGPQTKFQNKR